MSYSKQIIVWCERELEDMDLDSCDSFKTIHTPSVKKARQLLKSEGWTYKNNKDYCPECSKVIQDSK